MLCPFCKEEIADGAIKCKHCGSMLVQQQSQHVGNVPPPAPFQIPGQSPSPVRSAADVSGLEPVWQERFRLLEQAGGTESRWKMSNSKQLTSAERMKIVFNILAFLFGPIYYLVKGMWLKAILILVVGIIAALVLDAIATAMHFEAIKIAANFMIPAWCSAFACFDYYQLKVKGKQL